MIIYKITNILNNKIYIGQTINKNPWRRIRNHFQTSPSRKNTIINNAIKKYGKNNFKFDIIDKALDQKTLDELEVKYIKEFNSLVPNGYNIKTGGRGGSKLTEEILAIVAKKNSEKMKGVPKSLAHRQAMSLSRKGFTSNARITANLAMIEKRKLAGEFIKIIAINIKTNEELHFNSISDCANSLDLFADNVYKASRGLEGRTQSGGYRFITEKYKSEAPLPTPENPLKGIFKVNKGGYALTLNKVYIGYRKTMEEILKLKSEYLNKKTKV